MKKTRKCATLLTLILIMGSCLNVSAKTIQPSENIKAEIGTIYYDSSLANKPTMRAVTAPTAEAPYYPYSGNWSNTQNYTYTKYYFNSYYFETKADGAYKVDFYQKGGNYVTSVTPGQSITDGKYYMRIDLHIIPNYYAVITNTSGSPSKNATYTAKN